MVVKDDEYYVDMALRSVLPYVDGVYIQDQMSTDGTFERFVNCQMSRATSKSSLSIL
jgi:hypothetical protein